MRSARSAGPRVVDAVIELIRDEDEDVRRAAIEILNQTKDERAVNFLIEATKDKDWWVSERAVDALAEIGSKKAVPTLMELLNSENTRSLPTVARALGKLGDARVIEPMVRLLERPEKEIKVEAINALARLADDKRADSVRSYIQAAGANATDETIQHAAMRALEEIDNRYSSTAVAAAAATAANVKAAKMAEPARTLLIEKGDVDAVLKKAEETAATAVKMDISTLKNGDIIEGRYKFIEKIGKGAFGTVVLVEDTVVDERLILKFLNPNVSQDEEMMKRFVHELRYSRKITHKNVIRIYDFLYMRGNYAISMEYFPGHTLGSEIVNEKPLPLPRAIQYGIDIATGMTVAHQVGVVHRDLKPANIMINNEGLLKVLDFGVAAAQKEGDTQLTKTGYVIGSPKYMAPEQILGKKVDQRADIYSVGVIMYEMITGQPPYSRGDHMSVMYQHVQGKAKAPIDVNPQLPKPLSDLVAQAMSVDKQKRHQTMDELRLALEKMRPVAVRSAPHGTHRCIPEAGHRPGLLGHPLRRRPAAPAADARRPDADQVPRPEPGGAGRLHHRDRQQAEPGPPAQGPRRRLLVRVVERRALPRQRLSARTPASAPRSGRFPPIRPRSTGSRCRRSSRSCATTTRA